MFLIVEQVIKVGSAGRRIGIDAQAGALPRSRLVQSQKRRSADDGLWFGHRGRCPGCGRILRCWHGRRGNRRRRNRRYLGRPVWRCDGRGSWQQSRAAHAAKAVRLRIFVATTGAAHQSSSYLLHSLRYLVGSMQQEDKGSIREMNPRQAEDKAGTFRL